MEALKDANGQAADVHLRDYMWVVRKHLGIAVTFLVVTVASVTFVTFKTRPVYRATAEIYIERQTPGLSSLRDAYELGGPPDEYRKTQHQIIRSRPIIAAVMKRNRIESHEMLSRSSDPVETLREAVTVTPKEGTYLATVSMEGYDPLEAADWLNDLLDEYVSYVELKHRTTSSEVQRGISQEIPKLSTKLLESEARLIEFQRSCNVLSYEKQQEILFKKLEQLDGALTASQKERIAIEAKLAALSSIPDSGGEDGTPIPSLPDGIESPVLSSYRAREAALMEQLSQCASRFRDGHPQFVETVDKLRKLRIEMVGEIARLKRTVSDSLSMKKKEEEGLASLVRSHMEEVRSLDEKSNQFQALKSEVDSTRRMYQEFLERRRELESSSGFGALNINVVDRAIPQMSPVRPKKLLNVTLALIVGILGGVALAFFFEYLDDTIKTPDDVKDMLDAPFLGLIPVISRTEIEASRGVVARGDGPSGVSESFRAVRTGISFSLPAQGPGRNVIMLTSPGPEEGKSLNSVNLAVTMAKSDQKVLLVDADLRKPAVGRMLELGDGPGLSEALAGTTSLDDAVVKTGIENLWALRSGAIPPNPSELLGSQRMKDLIAEMGSKFDYTVIDTPPAGVVTDPLVIAPSVHGVVLVISSGTTRKKAAVHCAEQMERARANVLGVVLNSFNYPKSPYYKYSYYRYRHYRKSQAEGSDGQ